MTSVSWTRSDSPNFQLGWTDFKSPTLRKCLFSCVYGKMFHVFSSIIFHYVSSMMHLFTYLRQKIQSLNVQTYLKKFPPAIGDSCCVCPTALASFLHLLSLSSKTDHTQTPPTLTMSGTSPLKAVGGVPSESGQSSGVGLTFFISCRGGSWQRPCQALCLSWKWRRRARVALGCVYVLWWALTHCEEPLTRQFVVEIVIL